MEMTSRTNTIKVKEPEKRDVWTNKWHFLMVCIANSVGLGNIWRFPFTAYENGGGAFLIPYVIILLLIGRPIYYFEMAIGQFSSLSSVKIYNICPLFRGIGVGQIVATICLVTYYCSLIAITIYYFVASFAKELPWSVCEASWGPDCINSKPNVSHPSGQLNGFSNLTRGVSSSEIYFLKVVLKEKLDISDGIGSPDWKLTVCLFVAWTVAFLVIINGIKSSGKASYFLALFPYVIIAILFVRAVTLEGAGKGILYLIKPQWGELLNPKVWKEAIVQIFFSLGVSFGSIIMYASYNPFNHNIYRDAMIVTSIDTLTSLLGGMTIFAILGNLAHNLGHESVADVVKSGTGLAFISYPDAISKFEYVPQVFAVLFFFMLFVLGIGCLIALQNAIVTVICDQFHCKFWQIALATCAGGFLLGLMYICPGGQWMLTLIDYFGGTYIVLPLAIFEMVAVFWVYGLENFCWDIEYMSGKPVSYYWRICWSIVTPVLMTIIFVYTVISTKTLTYSRLDYPKEYIAAGWALFAFGVFQFPLWAVYEITQNSKIAFWDAFIESTKPDNWGPSDPEKRIEWQRFKEDAKERRKQQAYSLGHSFFQQKLCILLGRYRS